MLKTPLGIWYSKPREEAWAIQSKPSRLMSDKRMQLQPTGCFPQLWKAVVMVERPCGQPGHTALPLGSYGWSCLAVVRTHLTFAVSIVINLDFGSSEAGISMQFTVVEVGLAVTATYRPLVRFALLKQTQTRMFVQLWISTHRHTHTQSHFVRALSTTRDGAAIVPGYRQPQFWPTDPVSVACGP